MEPNALQCPVPHAAPPDRLLLAHGEGARLSRRLIRDEILPVFDNAHLRALGDAALVALESEELAVTTDCSVVSPLFFPGGDIGRLAVHSAVNDLAVSGARPLYLTLGIIAEEGLAIETLRRVLRSAAAAARDCGIAIIAGDTKVVPRGAADQLFLCTTGIGRKKPAVDLGPHRVRAGDAILVSGTIGDHGMAVLSAREALFEDAAIVSDTAPLHALVDTLIESGADVHFLRDPTRGGVSGVLHELTMSANWSIEIEEAAVPVAEPVRGACELLGLDPLYVANEGKLVAVVSADSADRALRACRDHPLGRQAARIGMIRSESGRDVLIRTPLGRWRVLDEPSGAPLPRIC